jgi:hypothetical protein
MDAQVIPAGTKRLAPRVEVPASQLVREFWGAPDEALFNQRTVAAVRDCSEALCERERWNGTGPSFMKTGGRVKYRKADVVEWINRHRTFSSTSEYPAQAA